MAKLHFKYGTMNSGKSIDLMRTAHNYEEVGYSVLVLKPLIDTKGEDKLDSRIGLQRKVDMLIDKDESILKLIKENINDSLACIFVDEAQFLNKNQIDELFFLTKEIDIPVICYGLRNNFMMNGFEGSIRLLEIAVGDVANPKYGSTISWWLYENAKVIYIKPQSEFNDTDEELAVSIETAEQLYDFFVKYR